MHQKYKTRNLSALVVLIVICFLAVLSGQEKLRESLVEVVPREFGMNTMGSIYTIFETDNGLTDFSSSKKPLPMPKITVYNSQDEFGQFYFELHNLEERKKRSAAKLKSFENRSDSINSSMTLLEEALKRDLNKIDKLDFGEFDFASGSVLFIDLGLKSSTGYEIHLRQIVDQGDIAVVQLRVLNPGPGCMVGAAFSRPYVLAYVHTKLDKVDIQSEEYFEKC